MEYNFDCGNYRGFVVVADNEPQAIQRFTEAAENGITHGFTMKDVTRIRMASPVQLIQAAIANAEARKWQSA